MTEQTDLTYMANLYMALADKTRLRLLNLMREQEVCVAYFTDVLGDSQPKISRHLAYLRNVGIVEARREGKWMNYSIKWPADRAVSAVIEATLQTLARQDDCRSDMQKYLESFGSNGESVQQGSREANTYADTDMTDTRPQYQESRSSHNELEEFLL